MTLLTQTERLQIFGLPPAGGSSPAVPNTLPTAAAPRSWFQVPKIVTAAFVYISNKILGSQSPTVAALGAIRPEPHSQHCGRPPCAPEHTKAHTDLSQSTYYLLSYIIGVLDTPLSKQIHAAPPPTASPLTAVPQFVCTLLWACHSHTDAMQLPGRVANSFAVNPLAAATALPKI